MLTSLHSFFDDRVVVFVSLRPGSRAPNHQRYAKMEAQLEYITHCIHVFARLGPICTYAQSVLINKRSALELSRKLIKSALLVGRNCSCPLPSSSSVFLLRLFFLFFLLPRPKNHAKTGEILHHSEAFTGNPCSAFSPMFMAVT